MKQYIKINLASPKNIIKWTERSLPNGKLIGEVKKSDTLNHDTFKPIMEGLFCERIFGPTINWECFCKRYKKVQRKIKEKKNISICPRCNVEINESNLRNYRLGYINLATNIVHIWYLKNIPSYICIMINKSIKETNNIAYNKSYLLFRRAQKEEWITGGEAISILLKRIKIENTKIMPCDSKIRQGIQKRTLNLIKRIKILNYFLQTKSSPEWMTIKYLPVLPPNTRPIVKLQDNTIITTDLNFLYAKVIDSNNKINKLRKMSVPETFLNNEKLILQENVDNLINNDTNKNISKINQKSLKSLSKIIQGKRGRFRENLLGKTVDFSGRSVIVVEPKLKINQCGLPKEIALELFQPFIIKKLIELKIIKTIRDGKNILNLKSEISLRILEKLSKTHTILLNRAPTLHRLGIQSFEPILINGKAIQLHPLVCSAFNADFDGDQMGIHIPLSLKAQTEARVLMISSNNCNSPATGQPNIVPSQDMILGCYFLTIENTSLYYLLQNILRLTIKAHFNKIKLLKPIENYFHIWNIRMIFSICKNIITTQKKRTTVGRLIFNKIITELL
uniref:DNA-directed RNA polymerase subunit n=1 Tax=Monomorphina aenigmatica TaxID=304863 RepID=L0BIE6_MONAE|nr:beta' subunit of RNA polymerase [Monomorphina aenigmatica]AFZ88781.1 beta' subunit of RNA polymerase [Monomorphina aenigmatica]